MPRRESWVRREARPFFQKFLWRSIFLLFSETGRGCQLPTTAVPNLGRGCFTKYLVASLPNTEVFDFSTLSQPLSTKWALLLPWPCELNALSRGAALVLSSLTIKPIKVATASETLLRGEKGWNKRRLRAQHFSASSKTFPAGWE